MGSHQTDIIRIYTSANLPSEFLVLTPKQRAFVMALFELPDPTLADCVRAAGYAGTGQTIHSMGQKLMHHQGVQAAMQAEMYRRAEGTPLYARNGVQPWSPRSIQSPPYCLELCRHAGSLRSQS